MDKYEVKCPQNFDKNRLVKVSNGEKTSEQLRQEVIRKYSPR